MYRRTDFLMCCALLPFCAASLFSQTAASDSRVATFRAETRLVVLDVVVTNGKGEPAPGLHREDFQVTEDGKPQNISVFEEHTGSGHLGQASPHASRRVHELSARQDTGLGERVAAGLVEYSTAGPGLCAGTNHQVPKEDYSRRVISSVYPRSTAPHG